MKLTRFILPIDSQCLLPFSACIFSSFLKLKSHSSYFPFVLLFALKGGKRTKHFKYGEKSITYFGHHFKAKQQGIGALEVF